MIHALGIMERELRVRARRRATVWIRVGVAALATLTTCRWIGSNLATGSSQIGAMIFGALTWLCFGFCLVEGARQTVDTISGERREGTLGLLFLTRLGGLDVVMGKLTASSLQSCYGLLAVFPVLGIPLVAGGVTAGEFWRTQLALVTTLLGAAAAGIWVSARSRDLMKALLAVTGLLAGWLVLPSLLAALRPGWPGLSPALGVILAADGHYRADPARFWTTQALLVGLIGLLLYLAGRETQRSWRELGDEPGPGVRPEADPGAKSGWGYRIPSRMHARPAPAGRSASRGGWEIPRVGRALIWVAVLLPVAMMLASQVVFRWVGPAMGVGGMVSFMGVGAGIGSLALLAYVAGRPWAGARGSGALELLLCTPVDVNDLVHRHWASLWRCLRWPLALGLLLPGGLYFLMWMSLAGGPGSPPWAYLLLLQLPSVLSQAAAMIAACWVASWLAVATRSLGHAVGGTVALVLAGPWVLGTAAGALLLFGGIPTSLTSSAPWWVWLAAGSRPFVGLVWSIGLISWARHRLLGRLRPAAAGDLRTWR